MARTSRLSLSAVPLLVWDQLQDTEALKEERARLSAALRTCRPYARRRVRLELRLAAVTARLLAVETEISRDRILRRD